MCVETNAESRVGTHIIARCYIYYDVVYPRTEWPTYAKSVKALAQFCGFAWRDANPSGAASIQWFNEYCRERDPQKLQRILDYNEDDCQAMAVLKDYLLELQAQGKGG